MQFIIQDQFVGDGQPCFIIAEAGVNHDGDIKKAMKLIDIAKKSGANAVKFQTWITDEIVTKTTSQAEYQFENTGIKQSQYEMLKRLELGFDEFERLKCYADEKGIIFLSTPDDEKSLNFLDKLGLPAFKIGSGELTNIIMLEQVAKKNKPIILSTGMANLEEIDDSVKAIYKTGNKKLVLLHCTSQYPTNYNDVNLRAMLTLKSKFNTIVGYSDHTLGILVPQIAVSLGASVIEKHFTYNKNAKGPDHKCSLNPNELKEMVEMIRLIETILGTSEKKPTNGELKLRNLIRKTIVASTNIPKGTVITKNMLTVKRSHGTLNPKNIKDVIGRTSLVEIKKDTPINIKDLK